MVYFLALLPATILTIAGYGVLFLSHRSEGALKTFGRYLGIWAFTLAGLVLLGAIIAAARGPRENFLGYLGREPMPGCPSMRWWRHPAPGGGARVPSGTPALPPAAPAGSTPPH